MRMLWEVVGLESVIQVSDLLLQVFSATDADCSVLKGSSLLQSGLSDGGELSICVGLLTIHYSGQLVPFSSHQYIKEGNLSVHFLLHGELYGLVLAVEVVRMQHLLFAHRTGLDIESRLI